MDDGMDGGGHFVPSERDAGDRDPGHDVRPFEPEPVPPGPPPRPRRAAGPGAPRESRDQARHALHARLRTTNEWVGTARLLEHLEHATDWGAYGSPESRRRTLQNWLRRLCELPPGDRGFEVREGAAGAYEYRGDKRGRPALASACLALLAQRLLEPLLPVDYVESDLRSHFEAARERVAEDARRLGGNGHAVGQLVERIAVAPRGQRLVREQPSYDVAAAVTDAILRRRRLTARYGGRERRLHPYGLIFRDPKFYLLAAEDGDLATSPDPTLKLFVCSRFETLAVDTARNRVPDDFAVADWIAARGLDVPMQRVDAPCGREFELVLRVHATGGNLLRDLADFPLAADQSIEPETDGAACLLRAPGQRATEALLEWILGRAEFVEVVAPDFLRSAVGARIESMAARYRDLSPRTVGAAPDPDVGSDARTTR